MMYSKCHLFELALILVLRTWATDSTAFRCIINPVVVPQDSICLDSSIGNTRYYSGVAHYSLGSSDDSVLVHAYLEEVPFKRFRLFDSIYAGHSLFRNIDKYCTGAIGWVKPGTDLRVRWSYSTSNSKNHCRIKIGVGNLQYVNTQMIIDYTPSSPGLNKQIWAYSYNNLGLLHEIRLWEADTGSAPSQNHLCYYTLNGQALQNNATNYTYDADSRIIFIRTGTPLSGNYSIYGYIYDSLNQAIKQLYLAPEATPQNFGLPLNRDSLGYDSLGRIIYRDYFFSTDIGGAAFDTIKFPECSGFSFTGLYAHKYFFGKIKSWPDSTISSEMDTSTHQILVKAVTSNIGTTVRGPDSSITRIICFDKPGTCWGSDKYIEQKKLYHYDNWGFLISTDFYERLSSLDSFVKSQSSLDYRQEYDPLGNVTKFYSIYDNNDKLEWEAEYDTFNYVFKRREFSNTDTTYISFTWQLLDLTALPEMAHE